MNVNVVEVFPHVRSVFGEGCRIERVREVRGGARKQVFYIDLARPEVRCVLYIWHDVNRYFSERDHLDAAQSDAQAPLLFEANTKLLQSLGVDTPQIYRSGLLDQGHHFALVEYVGGVNLTAFTASASPEANVRVFERVGELLRAINALERPYPGTVLDQKSPYGTSSHGHALERARLELKVVARDHAGVAERAAEIENALRTPLEQLEPRRSYRLVHGELGPEHILLRQGGEVPCVIDFDNAHFFDVEAEHALLRFRFGQDVYDRYLRRNDLDDARLRFYRLALHVSFVYAGSRFLARNFHDRAWAQALFDTNLGRVLDLL